MFSNIFTKTRVYEDSNGMYNISTITTEFVTGTIDISELKVSLVLLWLYEDDKSGGC